MSRRRTPPDSPEAGAARRAPPGAKRKASGQAPRRRATPRPRAPAPPPVAAPEAALGLGREALPAVFLLGSWVLAQLYPFVPSLSPTKYWRAIRPFFENPLPAGGDVFRLCLCWLLCCLLLESAAGADAVPRLFLMLAGGVFAARIVIADTALSGGVIDAALVALVLWMLLFRRAPGRHALLAAFLATTVAALRLPAHAAGAAPHGWVWVPFLGLFHATAATVTTWLLDRVFLYGGLIWLLGRAGLRPLAATLCVALPLLLGGALAPQGLQTSDAVLALVLAALLHAMSGGRFVWRR